MSETEYGFKLQITKGSTGKVEIDGYCSEMALSVLNVTRKEKTNCCKHNLPLHNESGR